MKRLSLASIIAVSFLIVATMSASDGICAEKLDRKLKIGFLPLNVMTVPYADYIGAWKDEGLDVECQLFRGGPALVEAMMAGGLDAADIGYVPMMYAADRGMPMYFLTTDGIMTKHYPMFMITVRPDSDIKTFKDLAGKTIALHQRGTMEDGWLSAACDKYGMKKTDLDITFVPFPQQGGVLEHKQVDASFPHPPFIALQEYSNQGKVVFDLSNVMEYTLISGLAVRREFAEKYPDITKKIAKGYIKAGRWVDDNQREARSKVLTDKKYIGLKPEVVDLVRMPYWPRNGLPLMPSVWNIYNMMVKTEMIKPWSEPQAKMKQYWIEPTMKYTIPALKELGINEDPYTYSVLRISLPYLDKNPEAYFAPWEKEDADLIIFKPGIEKLKAKKGD
jgi:NitT/TauT family transport system substrate-binding protein